MSASSAGGRWERPDLAQVLEDRAGEAMELNQRYLNRQLGRVVRTLGFDREWVHGRGPYLIDAEGNEYLDLYAGYGVFSLGRNHPYVQEQLHRRDEADPANLPQIGVSTLAGVLAEELVGRAPDPIDAAVLCSSGTEAVEAALKLGRAATGRPRILYCDRGVPRAHDRFAVGQRQRRVPRAVRTAAARPPTRSRSAISTRCERELARGDVAAFIVEPIQGKGVYVAPDDYLAGRRELCRAAGTLLIVDEVQTGLGRTGRFLALEHWGICSRTWSRCPRRCRAAIVPVGALLASRAVFDATFDSMERSVVHGSTFGNGDLAAAAALATLTVIEREGLVARAAELGDLLLELTRPLVDRFEIVREVRGLGLMWGIELGPPVGPGARSVCGRRSSAGSRGCSPRW